MKRAITMSVGALVLSLFLASTALANSKCFSTGPLENAAETETATASTAFTVKILNNDNEDDVDANIVAFRFLDSNGEEPRRKMFIEATSVEIPPLSSIARVILLGLAPQFEIQVSVENGDSDNNNNDINNNHIIVLISGWGKDTDGNLIAAHRLVHSEWVRINCETFGLIPGATPAD